MLNFKVARKITAFVLMITMLVPMSALSADAATVCTYDFSSFTETDALAFVNDHDIAIPTNLQTSGFLSALTLDFILRSYQMPNVPFCFNYYETQIYAETIRSTVKQYVGRDAMPLTVSTASYSLQYNTVQDENGNWVTSGGVFNPKWITYNCYAYSINRAEQPAFYNTSKQYQPGDMSNSGTFATCSSIDKLAAIVRSDLLAMGYSNVTLSSSIPTINSSQELICVRMNTGVDYHFMRYDIETNAWYHKPGTTAILKYNYIPSNSALWYSECCTASGTYLSSYVYDSEIVYITYEKNRINIGRDTASRVYIEPNKDAFYEVVVDNSGCYDVNLASDYTIQYELYDTDFDVVSSGSGVSISFCLNAVASDKYYLRINFVSNSSLCYVDISSIEHSHLYTYSYLWRSNTSHISTCRCGDSMSSAHVLSADAFASGEEYAVCLLCGGLATAGVIMVNSNCLCHSANGSFILPNGNIVLVPEDLDAYLNGCLTFCSGDIL